MTVAPKANISNKLQWFDFPDSLLDRGTRGVMVMNLDLIQANWKQSTGKAKAK